MVVVYMDVFTMKRVLKIIFIFIMVSIIGIVALPSVVSTSWGKDQFLRVVNLWIPGNVTADNIKIHWFGNQKFENLHYSDSKAGTKIDLQSFTTNSSLFSLIRSGLWQGTTELVNLSGTIKSQTDGKPITLKDVNGKFSSSTSSQPGFARFTGFTEQGKVSGSFEIDAELRGFEQVKLNANIVNFPVGILEAISAIQYPQYEINFSEFLGDRLNLSIEETIQNKTIEFNLQCNTPTLILNLTGTVETPEQTDFMVIDLKGNVRQDGETVHITAHSEIKQPRTVSDLLQNLLQPKKLNVNFDDLPLRLADMLFDWENRLENAIGKKVNIHIQSSPDRPLQEVSIQIESDRLSIPSMSVTVDQPILLGQLSSISGRILSDNLTYRSKDDHSRITVKGLNSPWKYEPKAKKFYTDINMDHMRLSEKGIDSEYAFENVHVKLNSQNQFEQINFVIDLRSKNKKILTATGRLDKTDPFSLNLNAYAHSFPAHSILRMVDLSWSDKIQALLGDTVNGKFDIKLSQKQGTLLAQLNGQKGTLFMDGHVSNGTLYLNQPFTAEVVATPYLGQHVLKLLVPFLTTAIGSNAPLKVTIDNNGFSYPLLDYNPEQIQINQAVVELGKMQFENKGQLKEILHVLKPEPQEKISIWFTPLNINVTNGTVNVQRMDMLVMDRYHIATWGFVNLGNEKVNIVVGITGDALSQALEIRQIDDDYMLQLHVKGKLGHTKVDKEHTAVRIGSLLAQSQGGPGGLVIGTLLDIANGLKDSKIPPPTTDPLPWANEKRILQSNKRESDNNDTLKKIQEDAKSLLKNLFR